MRKTTKGALAVGAGVALLLGGAGTLAAWSTSTDLGGQTVSSGDLNLALTGTATWKWGTATSATACTVGATDFVPASQKMVPGDCVVYTQPITVTAVGQNLKASLTVTATPLTTGFGGKLSTATTTTLTPVTGLSGTGPFLFDATVAPGKSITAVGTSVTTLVFDPATTGTTGANTSATLNSVTLLLKQTAPTS